MKEIWKDVPGYEGLYRVSNLGNVFSLRNDRCLTQRVYGDGYVRVPLVSLSGKHKLWLSHRIVALAFIPNPDNLPEVNHKDEDKTNNHRENLEWCTRKYNANYGTAMKRMATTNSKAVEQLSDGKVTKRWDSIKDAGRDGFDRGNISKCCSGKLRTYKGFEWRYAI